MSSQRVGVKLGDLKVTFGQARIFLIVGDIENIGNGAIRFKVTCHRAVARDWMRRVIGDFARQGGRNGTTSDDEDDHRVFNVVIPVGDLMPDAVAEEALGIYGSAMYGLARQVVQLTAT